MVRRIFREYVGESDEDEISQREICRRLNREGITAQRGRWTQGSISKLLSCITYAGKVEVNGVAYDGQHAPIIDQDLWKSAQALRAANERARSVGQ